MCVFDLMCPGFSYKDSSDMVKQDFEKAIETMAVAFSSR